MQNLNFPESCLLKTFPGTCIYLTISSICRLILISPFICLLGHGLAQFTHDLI